MAPVIQKEPFGYSIEGVPFWHWVVFVREAGKSMVLDSRAALKNNVRRDVGRMAPQWFIEVTPGS